MFYFSSFVLLSNLSHISDYISNIPEVIYLTIGNLEFCQSLFLALNITKTVVKVPH